jgi:hypothetical protein
MQNATVTTELPATNWTGSQKTFELVRSQIESRFGTETAANFDPLTDARTFRSWLDLGFVVRKNEKGIRSFILVRRKGSKDNDDKVVRNIYLFHKNQVEPLTPKSSL